MNPNLTVDELAALRAYAQGRRADLTATALGEARVRLSAAGLVRNCGNSENPMMVTPTTAGLKLLARLNRLEPMTAAAADWVYQVVLTGTYRDSCTVEGDPRLIRNCSCQHGACGHCTSGSHEQCRTHADGPLVGPEAYVVNHRGGARTAVWLSGKPCAWRCPCECPVPEPKLGQLALVDATPGTKRHGQPETRHRREAFGQLELFTLAGGGS